METARLIVDEPGDGAWNMAVDQALLDSTDNNAKITLRFYRWAEPTLSLGYFQSHLDREKHTPSHPCAMVRRASGGGAILHHHELTYSLCVPSHNRLSKQNTELYTTVHEQIIGLLNKVGIRCMLFRDVAEQERQGYDNNSFLCFQRRTDGDIVLNGNKIVGSAQRRSRKALIQHGSILLARSEFAPELLGLSELTDVTSELDFVAQLTASIGKALSLTFETSDLSESEKSSANNLKASQFGSSQWTRKR